MLIPSIVVTKLNDASSVDLRVKFITGPPVNPRCTVEQSIPNKIIETLRLISKGFGMTWGA